MSSPNDASTPTGEVSPTRAIVETIATREGVDVTDVEPPAYDPLYAVIDPEALDDLFRSEEGSAVDVSVTLEYAGYELVVRGDGHVDVVDRSSGASGTDLFEE